MHDQLFLKNFMEFVILDPLALELYGGLGFNSCVMAFVTAFFSFAMGFLTASELS